MMFGFLKGNRHASDLNVLMQESDTVLNEFTPNEYRVIRVDEEAAGRTPSGEQVYLPLLNEDTGIQQFRKVFWDKGYYADRYVGGYNPSIVCLCKIMKVEKAKTTYDGWSLPHLVVENVATHQQFDFAKIVQGKFSIIRNARTGAGDHFERPIMPYLLKLNHFKGFSHQPTYIGVQLEKVSNAEVVAHLEHIAKVKQREREQQAQKDLHEKRSSAITGTMLEELYRKLDG